ncbi:MAG: alkaline phosphatase family protein [candidate division KSB1 bacterium]|nr:alkaline phosphatase family protein [candidate division KSB1 bacterium]MDZ7302058.1 alkaline phosphatase family protein [candidate division KSB1 bacterium]MDZ7311100.1 alkaline phosphatase family protein [candidate division KSB1 bacterium]
MHLLLLFIDGLGIGKHDSETNPLARYPSPFLSIFQNEPLPKLPYGGVIIPTRADMDMPGLPQSATGQTAIFTGQNAAKVLGHHQSGFPTPTLRRLLHESSIFRKIRELGKKGVFANSLSQEYFDRRGERISATTRALLAGGFPWLDMDDLRAGRAMSHDLTNEFLRDLGFQVPLRTPAESAKILAALCQQNDFVLFEFILTDFVGHSQEMTLAQEVIHRLDILLGTLLAQINLQDTTVVLTSDHGNFEDLSIKTHTTNLVPTCVWGVGQEIFVERVKRIEDIAGVLAEVLQRVS